MQMYCFGPCEGWIDYNIPQIYWQIGHPAADYEILVKLGGIRKTSLVHQSIRMVCYLLAISYISIRHFPESRETFATVTDIVSRYDVDAIHMDDYFYPYPVND